MAKGKHSEAEIIGALKQLEAGRTAEDVGREMGVSKHTIYARKAKFGGLDVNEAQRRAAASEELEAAVRRQARRPRGRLADAAGRVAPHQAGY